MDDAVIDIDVTDVVRQYATRLHAFDGALDALDHVEQIDAVHTIVGKGVELDIVNAEDAAGFVRASFELRKLASILRPVTLVGPARRPFGQDKNVHLPAFIDHACHAAAAAEHFIVWVRGDHERSVHEDSFTSVCVMRTSAIT